MQFFKILIFVFLPILCFSQPQVDNFDYYVRTDGDDQRFNAGGRVVFDSSAYFVQLPDETIKVNVFKTGSTIEGDLILFGYMADKLRVIEYPDGSVSGFFLWSKGRMFYLNVKNF